MPLLYFRVEYLFYFKIFLWAWWSSQMTLNSFYVLKYAKWTARYQSHNAKWNAHYQSHNVKWTAHYQSHNAKWTASDQEATPEDEEDCRPCDHAFERKRFTVLSIILALASIRQT